MENFVKLKKFLLMLLLTAFFVNFAEAGVSVFRSDGMRFTGVDGIEYIGIDGMRFTGVDGFLNTQVNGIRFTGVDGTRFTGVDGTRFSGVDGVTFVGSNGMSFDDADGMRFTGVDGVRFTGVDGMRFTGVDGTTYQANSILIKRADGVEVVKPVNVSLVGLGNLQFSGTDGSAATAEGMRLNGADAVKFTNAETVVGFGANGVLFSLNAPKNFTIAGVDGARFTGVDAAFSQLNGARFTGVDGVRFTGVDGGASVAVGGLQTVDPKLAILLDQATDDSTINAVVVFHNYPTETDLNNLKQIGIVGGTQFRRLPMVYVSGTKQQISAISQLPNVRSIYGNRTLKFNSDPYFKPTQISRVAPDRDLQTRIGGLPVSGKNVTVAVLDTGVNGLHGDLAGRVLQNVRLVETQSVAAGFINPAPVENVPNTDLVSGHGTFVAGVIAASGADSSGKYNGVAPGANILGLSAGDLSLLSVLSGFDYILDKGVGYNVRVVNCSFSSDTIFDYNDPVNIATKMLTDGNISVVFSAGNSGAGNGSLNPYSAAPWVISVGATDQNGVLADFSSRGVFGDPQFSPSLVAPGVNVVSLRAVGTQNGMLGLTGSDAQRLTPAELPFYTTNSGTSFSAPQVAGAVALMLETNPNLTPAQIKNILQRSATPMPDYFAHEVGAGMLDTYAAVLEAAFPLRKTGVFRSIVNDANAQFISSAAPPFDGSVSPNSYFMKYVPVPLNTIQTSVYIAWGGLDNMNDLSLKLYDPSANLRGASNYLNASDIGGRNERVTVNAPTGGFWQAIIENTYNLGSTQNFQGIIETTRAQTGQIYDINNLPITNQCLIYESLRKLLMQSNGNKFAPADQITRADLAATIVRSGKIPQFVAAAQTFSDVADLTTRNAAEAVQFNPNGKLFYDAGTSGQFFPDQFASRLTAAIAMVKANQLETLAASSTLPPTVTDATLIPLQWRGYAAVALQKGWLTADNGKFNPNGFVTRFEVTKMLLNK